MQNLVRIALFAHLLIAGAANALAESASFSPGPCPVDLASIKANIDCGVLRVPETRDSKSNRSVALPVVRVRASSADALPDPVIYLHGGPGGGIMDDLPEKLTDPRWQHLIGGNRDWLFFDQRGGGLSQPLLDCGQLGLSDTGFTSDADVVAASACAQRLIAANIDLSQYNVQTTVDDIVDLKNALGYKRFNLFSVSYGSRVAFAVQQYAPEELRAVVHDSPYPPEARGTEQLPMLLAREVRQTLALCAADKACNAAYPELESRLGQRLIAWLKTPQDYQGRQITVSDLASFLLDAIYDWDGIEALPKDLDSILTGDLSPIVDYLEGGGDFAEGQLLAHFCKEELPFEDTATMRQLAGDDPLAKAVLANTQRLFNACADWPVGAPNPKENTPVVSAVPSLLIAAEIDAGCPTDFSVAALPHLAKAQYVAVPNAVHSMTNNSDCVMAMVTHFLDNPLKPIATACLAEEHARVDFELPEEQ
ncbi:MAG: alpha/beta hydrolase [Halieaceae bacterium]